MIPSAPNLPSLLAHQGGWDEALLVLMPLLLIGGLLWLANRRVSAQLAEAEGATANDPERVEPGGGSEPDPD